MKDRERPAVGEIHWHRTKEEIFDVIQRETGKTLEGIKQEKGALRRVVMEVLYRAGGLKGPEIGRIFGIDYGPVSQERKRLRDTLPGDRKLRALMDRIVSSLSTN